MDNCRNWQLTLSLPLGASQDTPGILGSASDLSPEVKTWLFITPEYTRRFCFLFKVQETMKAFERKSNSVFKWYKGQEGPEQIFLSPSLWTFKFYPITCNSYLFIWMLCSSNARASLKTFHMPCRNPFKCSVCYLFSKSSQQLKTSTILQAWNTKCQKHIQRLFQTLSSSKQVT